MTRIGSVKKKVLLILLTGIALSYAKSGRKQIRIIRGAIDAWKDIDNRALKEAVRSLYSSKLIRKKTNKNGTTTFELSHNGRRVALSCDMENMSISKPNKWDRTWRIITFDVPERLKKVREAIRFHLKRLGFKELHRSVLVLPYECRNEIEYIVEFYNVRKHVRYVEAKYIDNELDLKSKFDLT